MDGNSVEIHNLKPSLFVSSLNLRQRAASGTEAHFWTPEGSEHHSASTCMTMGPIWKPGSGHVIRPSSPQVRELGHPISRCCFERQPGKSCLRPSGSAMLTLCQTITNSIQLPVQCCTEIICVMAVCMLTSPLQLVQSSCAGFFQGPLSLDTCVQPFHHE